RREDAERREALTKGVGAAVRTVDGLATEVDGFSVDGPHSGPYGRCRKNRQVRYCPWEEGGFFPGEGFASSGWRDWPDERAGAAPARRVAPARPISLLFTAGSFHGHAPDPFCSVRRTCRGSELLV